MATQPGNELKFSEEGLYRLGLTGQPFADPLPQFEDTARITQLNVALSLLQSGERVVFVRASAGLGKTTFLQRLIELQPPGLQMTYMQAAPTTTAEELFANLRACMENDPELAATSIDRSQIKHKIKGARRAGTRPVIVIDDAEQLPEQTSSELISLWSELDRSGEGFGIVLATNQNQEGKARKGRTSLDSLLPQERIHTTHLFPFNEQQTDAYLEHRLTSAGAEPDLLSKKEKQAIFYDSDGYPSAIHHHAYRTLSDRLAKRYDDLPSATSPIKKGDKRLRWPLLAGSGAAIFCAGAAWYVSGTDIFSISEPDLDITAQPPTENGTANTSEPPEGTPLQGGDSESEALRDDGEAPYDLTMPSQYSFSRELRADLETESDQVDDDLQDDSPSLEEEAAETGHEEPEAEDEQTQDIAAEDDHEHELQQDEAEPLDEDPEVAAATEETAPDEQEQLAAAEADDPEDQDTNQWLEEQNSEHFTIQLLGARNRDSVVNYAEEHGLNEDTQIIESRREGEPWYILVYGSHEDRTAANTQINQLPDEVRRFGPWARTFSSIEEAIDN
ncbi:DamX [Halorhodospira halochloris]|uniref:DamX n=1 Tax=Halorhodospira halochloris TaxID=1052 RepID=A0A0X8X8W2_HALHR|nr:AAA family ATPase [Halorhodospira halochloris]MBK1651294.1 hypothetical protein [Halorhodospira halochloris]BAU57574.1 DamX [Halorhodospira halochloris]